ncbi:MAG: preprotein translocase subunit SecE [Candidatus Omnitrophica bacterium]|nr:preprotein translocase subunit SecE [Candidatus Omnitrophota bacterium]
MIARTKKFLSEVQTEMKKVTWPERQELVGSTAIVIVSTILLATYIGLWDLVFSRLMNFLIR